MELIEKKSVRELRHENMRYAIIRMEEALKLMKKQIKDEGG